MRILKNLLTVLILGCGIPITAIAASSSTYVAPDTVDLSKALAKDTNVPNGLAALDQNSNVTSPILASQFRVQTKYNSPDGTVVSIPRIEYDDSDTTYNGVLGGESLMVGGYADSSGTVGHINLNVQGLPYGPYNMGCVLCVFSSRDAYSGAESQAALSGINFWANPVFAITGGDMATAVSYRGIVNEHSRGMLFAKSYTSDSVALQSPMTAEQMSELHQGMYITSNSIDPNCTSTLDSTNIYKDCRLSGFIKSWDANNIYVVAWARRGGSNVAITPSVTTLDTTYTPYITDAVVWVGSGGKQFAGNDYITINADHVYSSSETVTTTADVAAGATTIPVSSVSSRWAINFLATVGDLKYAPIASVSSTNNTITLKQPITTAIPSGTTISIGSLPTETTPNFEILERDLRIQNASPEHPISFHGTTESFECDNCTGGGVSSDSYGYLINGPGGLANAYIAYMDAHAIEYKGYSTYIPSYGSPDATVVGSNHIMYDFASILPSNNTLHFGAKVFHDLSSSASWQDYSVRLGLTVDGNRINDTFSGGVDMAYMVWNYQGDNGGLCIINNNSLLNTCFHGSGGAEFHGVVTMDSDLDISGSQVFGSLSSSLPGLRMNSAVFEGMTYGPDTNIKQGYALGWNQLANTNMGDVWGGTDFYNLPGEGPGGFNWCVGATASTCKGNTVMSLTSSGELYINTLSLSVIVSHAPTQTLSVIKTGTYTESEKVWCHDCRSPGQAAGAGTGRWIVLDSASTWRTEDGIIATN